jgi:enoyl-[acyl-carrier protein] reductase II
MISSPICELLGIDYPVFQGGMAWISDGELAAAVSNAGGLGIISAGNASAERVRLQIRRCRELTDRPFGVNVMLMSPKVDEVAAMLAEEQVPVLTTGAGNPAKYMAAWREAGSKVIPVIASSAMARMMTKVGAVAVIAEGGESGGHVGEISTMALVPQVCDVTDLPVIAAGGIGDGRGMAAALMLGACGVQMGTRFLVAEECNVHPTYKAKILKAKDIDTIRTGIRLGHPVRSLKTPFSRSYAKLEYTIQNDEELAGQATGALRLAAVEGDEERGCFLAGQIAGMISREQSAADIVHEVCAEAEELLKVAPQWVI